jgi:hypothetical protein
MPSMSAIASGSFVKPRTFRRKADGPVVRAHDRLPLHGNEHLLEPGDSATYLCRLPHRWRNSGRESSRVLWIITPAIY